jgi:hypothetical protein
LYYYLAREPTPVFDKFLLLLNSNVCMYISTFSVTLFGDKLNAINVTGCCVVFSGVLLYKIVFQLEKQAKAEEGLKEHNVEYEVVGKLMNEITVADDDSDDVEAFSGRAVELVDRVRVKRYSDKEKTEETGLSENDGEGEGQAPKSPCERRRARSAGDSCITAVS